MDVVRKGNSVIKRISLLLAVALMAVMMMAATAAPAFAAKTQTFSKGTCTVKAGQGGGSGSIKDQHHGSCNSNGADV